MNLMLALLGCPAPTPTPLVEPSPVPTDEPTPTDVPTEEPGTAGFTLDSLALGFDIGTAWDRVDTDLLIYRFEGTWWNSDACSTCGGALVTARGLSVVHCQDLSPAGPPPGDTFQYGFEFDNPGVGVHDDYTLHLVEGQACATIGPAPTGDPSADLGTITVTEDLSFIVVEEPPASDVDIHSPIVVTFASPIDAVVSANDGLVTLENEAGANVPITVTYDGADLVVTPDDRLTSVRSAYTLDISGLVAESGALQAEPYDLTFRTELFDDTTVYRFRRPGGVAGEAMLAAPGGFVEHGNWATFPLRSLWRMAPSGTGYTMQTQQDGSQRLTAAALNDRPAMTAPVAGSDTQVWRFPVAGAASSGEYRIALGALTDFDVIGESGGVLRIISIGGLAPQRWTITDEGPWFP